MIIKKIYKFDVILYELVFICIKEEDSINMFWIFILI